MLREERIIKEIKEKGVFNTSYEQAEVSEVILKAISALEEQKNCEDIISRKAVHDLIENFNFDINKKINWPQMLCNRVAELPSIPMVQKTGE